MSRSYAPSACISPSREANTYVLALALSFGTGLAAITSANELVVADANRLNNDLIHFSQDVPQGLNCLVSAEHEGRGILCSGTDGSVATFDPRTRRKVSGFKIDRAVTALAVKGLSIGIGTEFKSQHAIVSCWDARQNRMLWQNAENNDEVTVVDFHPRRPEIILAGGDDGLVSIFDTSVAEEDDSLLQVINHGPVHKAGFLDENCVYALSSDQRFSIHPVSTLDDQQDPVPSVMGDLRPTIPCQYVIDVLRSKDSFAIAAGTNINQSQVDLVNVTNATDLAAGPCLDCQSKITLQPAHGEEVVRAVCFHEQARTVFTAGEDGCIRGFPLTESLGDDSSARSSGSKHKKRTDTRYKPY